MSAEIQMTQRTAKALITQFAGQANMLTIPRVFIAMTKSLEAALVLSQSLYWSERTSDPDGWFWKRPEDWDNELSLSEYQVRKARKILAPFGLETDLRTLNNTPTLYYRIDGDQLYKCILQFLQNAFCENSEMHSAKNAESTYTEITSKDYATESAPALDDPAIARTLNITPVKQNGATLGDRLSADPDACVPPAPAPRPIVHACADKPVTVPVPDTAFDALTRQPGERIIPGKKGAPPRSTKHVPPAAQHVTFAPTLAELLRIYPDRKDGAKQNATLARQVLALIDPAHYPQLLTNAAEYARRVKAGLQTDPRTPVMNLATFLSNDEWTYHTPPQKPSGATGGPRVIFGTRKGTSDAA